MGTETLRRRRTHEGHDGEGTTVTKMDDTNGEHNGGPPPLSPDPFPHISNGIPSGSPSMTNSKTKGAMTTTTTTTTISAQDKNGSTARPAMSGEAVKKDESRTKNILVRVVSGALMVSTATFVWLFNARTLSFISTGNRNHDSDSFHLLRLFTLSIDRFQDWYLPRVRIHGTRIHLRPCGSSRTHVGE